ncbi:MAG: hypothetical protein ACRDWE_04200, partial [Acidimicrobiales bacterium]
VDLEAVRESYKTKNTAQAKLVDVATKRLEDRPVKDLAHMVGVEQWGPAVIKQRLGGGPEPGSTLVQPTEEELAEGVRRLEAQRAGQNADAGATVEQR